MFSRRRDYLGIIICLLCLLPTAITGCSTNITSSEYADNPTAQRETLVQISTIDALLSGVYDGVMIFGILKEYGDFGIGTFAGLDGEMMGFDANFYQVKADGIAYPVSDSMETPFASVTFFDVDRKDQLPEGMNYEQLLTKSKDAGGHVLEFKVEEAVASVDYTSEFLMILPGENSDFYNIDLTQDKQEELEEVEKKSTG